MWSQTTSKKRLIALPLLAILLANAAFAGTAVAEPRIWMSSASLERDATLVGEPVGVQVQLHNRGDGGVIGIDVLANGSDVASERIHVESDSDRKAVINVSFDEPGTYRIKANDKTAGTLTVTRLRVASVTERDDGQTAIVRAGGVAAGESMTANLPAQDGQPFALQRVTMTGPGSSFNRSVATYAPADGASFSVPSGQGASLVGAVEMDAISGVNTTSLRVAVDRDALNEHGLESNGVTVYRKTGDSFTPLTTEQAATTEDAIVYEASTDGGNQFVLGALTPEFAVRSADVDTEDASDGQRVVLKATVANEGQVAGDYEAEMRVDGVTVDRQNVTLQPGESKTVELDHVVTSKGEYDVGLGAERVSSVILTSDAISGSDQSDSSDTTADDTESTDGGLLDAEPSLPSLPAIGDVGTLEVGIGAGIVLLGGGLLLFVRR
ncbi:hypothetical protein SAMN05216559_2929 [Halomicrobium zhouii]|uniref:CARDB domain-containing protein n=1 Tax=Halomicrobium zhouii TaxID=767519 RepID=A0A1I6LRB0_9EURY|nr:CARDB domain-containing protein [Halomicrobium zhouii]SFS05830.1 hypothetical protein SAMN05216559_2929 [Halomicrobium zhouii]